MKCDLCLTYVWLKDNKEMKILRQQIVRKKYKTNKKIGELKNKRKNIVVDQRSLYPNGKYVFAVQTSIANIAKHFLRSFSIRLNKRLVYLCIRCLFYYLCSACLNICLNELNYYRENYTQFSVQNSLLRRHEIKVMYSRTSH